MGIGESIAAWKRKRTRQRLLASDRMYLPVLSFLPVRWRKAVPAHFSCIGSQACIRGVAIKLLLSSVLDACEYYANDEQYYV